MMRVIKLFFLGSILCTMGCREEVTCEKDHPHYVRGREYLKKNAPQKALAEFLKVIKSYPQPQRVYLEAGQIYANTYDDPVMAIYYYRQFLSVNQKVNNKQQEKLVNGLITSAKKRFLQQMIGENRELYSNHQNFLSLLKHLRQENDALRLEIKQLKSK